MIEADEGRQNIRISDGPVPTIVLNAHEMLHPDSQPTSASPIILGTASVFVVVCHAGETCYVVAAVSKSVVFPLVLGGF